jgi:hypothetical protein
MPGLIIGHHLVTEPVACQLVRGLSAFGGTRHEGEQRR